MNKEMKFALSKASCILALCFTLQALVLSSCMPTQSLSSKRLSSLNNTQVTNSNGVNGTNGKNAVADETNTDSTTVSSQRVELQHLVDPYSGTYKKKITIPKNYKGFLYLGGINVGALSGKLVKVRLNFGKDRQSIVIPASINRAPGIIPKTEIQVLTLDINKQLFQDMRLPYDLYDYNEYNTDSSLEPVTDPLDGNLYCRGLRLADDSTYIVTSENASCSLASDKCLYTYAKISDASFYDVSSLTKAPTSLGVWSSSTLFNADLASTMCLADHSYANFTSLFGSIIPTGLTYNGPYLPINQGEWQITDSALFGSYTNSDGIVNYLGLFETGIASNKGTWYKSLLFPRAGKLPLNSGINYIGSTSKFGSRSVLVSDSTGSSQYVDGCQLRVKSFNSSLNEGMGSCNVLANIEVFYMNGTTEVSVTSTNSLKIQLVRASNKNSDNKEVLASNFANCSSSTQCGSNECCFNKRCWSKDLVSQCIDETTSYGNQGNGASCTSDYQCGSLCCNSATGTCAPHNPNGSTQYFCSKDAGQACISQEFCKKEYIPVCKLYKNGYDIDGKLKCTVRCPTVATYGSCTSGICIAPKPANDTSGFDLVNCTGAIDP